MKCFYKYFVLLLSLNFIEGSFRCDYKYNEVAKAWFKHNIRPVKWSDARLRCALEGATLASPTTLEIETVMTQIMKDFFNPESEIFTGIHAFVSQGDYYSVEGIPLSEISLPWAENEPDNKGNNENCITLNGNGEMTDHSCEETRSYICYRTEEKKIKVNKCGTIDPEYRLDARTKSCYKFHTVPRNFSRAFMTCSAEGGHLVIINSEVEAKVLKEVFKKYPAKKMLGSFWKDVAFIGSYDWGENMEWKTIHGQTVWEAGYGTFKGQPNNASPGENCLAISRDGKLNNLCCKKRAAFICEKNPFFFAACEASPKEETEAKGQAETINQADSNKQTDLDEQAKSNEQAKPTEQVATTNLADSNVQAELTEQTDPGGQTETTSINIRYNNSH